MVEISCGICGKKSDAWYWMEPVTGKLPENVYKCPECDQAIRIESEEPGLIEVEGKLQVIPGKNNIVKEDKLSESF